MKLRLLCFIGLLVLPFLSFGVLPTLVYPAVNNTVYGTAIEVRPAASPSQNATYALQNIPNELVGQISVGLNNARVNTLDTAPAGTYTITVRATDNTGFIDASFTLVIQKAPLTVTANSSTITYCDGFPTCSATYTGFQNNENAGVLSGVLLCQYGIAAPAPVGSYTIDITTNSTLNSPNYNVTYVNGTLTVIQSPTTTVTPANSSILVGNAMTFTAAVNGNLNCVPIGSVVFTIDGLAQAPITLSNIGQCSITVTDFLPGVHTVSAAFSGSTNHLSSTSAQVLNTVCPIISIGQIAEGTVNVPYNQTVSVSPVDTYTFGIAIGQLPKGLVLNPLTGQLSGTPTEAGFFNFTIVAKNGISCSKSKAYSMKIVGNNCSGRYFEQANLSPPATGVVPIAYSPATVQGAPGDYHFESADFNNDGHLDIIMPSKDATDHAGYSLYLGNGSGGFTGGVPVATGAVASNNVSVTVADFDNDGDKDVVLGNVNTFELVILTNNGSGVFTQNIVATGNGGGGIGSAVAAKSGDFNKDGKPDFAILNSGNKKANIYLNTSTLGTISFASTATPIATDIFPRDLVIGYFNTDENLDVAVVNYSNNIVANTVSVAFGDGLGGFSLAAAFSVGLNSRDIKAGDIDNDGDTDLVTANYGTSTISILTNNGSGSFTVATKNVGSKPNGLAVNDYNGDGFVDILVSTQALIAPANTSSNVYLLLNNGSGSFSTPSTQGTDIFTVGAQPGSLLSGDFNSDGAVDFISANTGVDGLTGSLSVFLNNCPPTLSNVNINHGTGITNNLVLIANTFDGNQAANTLLPKINAGTSATLNGITVSNLSVSALGEITATISATCLATSADFSITITDNFNKTVSATLSITVVSGPNITAEPTNRNPCDGMLINIPVTATGLDLSYQWQISTDGGANFSNLTNLSPHSNISTNSLGILASTAVNGNKYRCVITGACGVATSQIINLNVQSAVSNLSGTIPNGTTQVFNSSSINSTQAITPVSNVTYQAGKSITFNPGFLADRQNTVNAEIIGCF
ncbi:MAG TPA: FG-GAP-like repeat-containing protein [Leadbetterella sp.]|nr:FG-GAP-like repeat-containing protein [Leadbetterella sp.]